MKNKFQTIYETSYGTVKAQFNKKMTFEEAEKLGKEYCLNKNVNYIKTESVNA